MSLPLLHVLYLTLLQLALTNQRMRRHAKRMFQHISCRLGAGVGSLIEICVGVPSWVRTPKTIHRDSIATKPQPMIVRTSLSIFGGSVDVIRQHLPSAATVKAEYFASHACFGTVHTVQCASKRLKRGVSSLSVVSYHAQKLSCFTPRSLRRLASSTLTPCVSNGIRGIEILFCILYSLASL